jgi:ATP-dependent protease ClpP protease subunit
MIHAQETQKLKDRLNQIYVKHTGQTFEAWSKHWNATISWIPSRRRTGA